MTIKGEYGQSPKGNFKVIDTIGVSHPYCITGKHVAWASEHFHGILGKEAIEDAEKNGGAVCDICKQANRRERRRILSFAEHETALLVECAIDMNTDIAAKEELQEYLLANKDLATANGYAGFAFMLKKGVKPA